MLPIRRLFPVFLMAFLATSCKHELTEIHKLPDGSDVEITYPAKENTPWKRVGYYPNGMKFQEDSVMKVNGIEVSNARWYYPNGKIWQYKFYRYNDLQYFRDYTPEGKIERSKGYPFLDTKPYNEIEIDSFPRRKRLMVVAMPPNCKVSYRVCDWIPESAKLDVETQHCMIYEVFNGSSFYPFRSDNSESFKKAIYWRIEDTLNGDIQKGFFVDEWFKSGTPHTKHIGMESGYTGPEKRLPSIVLKEGERIPDSSRFRDYKFNDGWLDIYDSDSVLIAEIGIKNGKRVKVNYPDGSLYPRNFSALLDSLLNKIDPGNNDVKFDRQILTASETRQGDFLSPLFYSGITAITNYYFDAGKGKNPFRVRITEASYPVSKEADEAFSKLRDLAMDLPGEKYIAPGLTYTNDYLIKTDRKIFWLNAGCSYSSSQFGVLKKLLLRSMDYRSISDSIYCKCGWSSIYPKSH